MKDLSKVLKVLIVYHIVMSLLCMFVSGSLYAQHERRISNPPLKVCRALSGGKGDAYVSGS